MHATLLEGTSHALAQNIQLLSSSRILIQTRCWMNDDRQSQVHCLQVLLQQPQCRREESANATGMQCHSASRAVFCEGTPICVYIFAEPWLAQISCSRNGCALLVSYISFPDTEHKHARVNSRSAAICCSRWMSTQHGVLMHMHLFCLRPAGLSGIPFTSAARLCLQPPGGLLIAALGRFVPLRNLPFDGRWHDIQMC